MTAKSDQVKGKAKQVTGIVTGDKNLEAEGNADRRSPRSSMRTSRHALAARHLRSLTPRRAPSDASTTATGRDGGTDDGGLRHR
jgi:hypothetical protein